MTTTKTISLLAKKKPYSICKMISFVNNINFDMSCAIILISFLSYCQAQATVLEAIPRLHSMSIPTKRPEDFFAQMAKSDDHMKRVKLKFEYWYIIYVVWCILYE